MQEGQRVFALKWDEIVRSYVSWQTVVSSVHIGAIEKIQRQNCRERLRNWEKGLGLVYVNVTYVTILLGYQLYPSIRKLFVFCYFTYVTYGKPIPLL